MRRILRWLVGLIFLGLIGVVASWASFMPARELRGVWASDSYGMMLSVGRLKVDIYRQSSVSCLQQLSYPAHRFALEKLERIGMERDGEDLLFQFPDALEPIRLRRQTALPETCTIPAEADQSPAAVFETFWQAMQENYAFFDLHEIDWPARRALSPKQGEQMSDPDLFERLIETLEGVDDGHVVIGNANFGWYSPGSPPSWARAELGLTPDRLTALAQETIDIRLQFVSGTGLVYGLRGDGIGYLLITSMSSKTGWNQSSYDAATIAFAQAAHLLQDADGIIVDIRNNPGGSDLVAMGFASFFTDQDRPAFRKSTRTPTGLGPPFDVTLRAHGEIAFPQPIVLLTSQSTIGSAEIFAMALREIPNVTLMGENTAGALSDVLEFALPNGWALGLSHQRYESVHGEMFEKTGVIPDIFIPVDADALAAGQDAALQAAIAHLNTN